MSSDKLATAAQWWKTDEDVAHDLIFQYVEAIEHERMEDLELDMQNAKLYDPRSNVFKSRRERTSADIYSFTNENIVKSTVNTACAIIGKNRPRCAFMTDGADWEMQRRAKDLERYIEALFHRSDVYPFGYMVFRDACILGTGVGKIINQDGYPGIERVLKDEIIIDEYEARTGKPRQMHQRKLIDRDAFEAWCVEEGIWGDDVAEAVRLADPGNRTWAGHRVLEENEILVIESWSLPSGKHKGRHSICVRGKTVLWEDFPEDCFPFVFFHWENPQEGFWGHSLVEEIASIQLRINKMNKFVDRAHDLISVPRVAMHISDANVQTKLNRTLGQIINYRSKAPQWMTPPAISGDYYEHLRNLRNAPYELSGVSQMQAQAKKPAGLESAVAIREYNDINTERFAIVAQAYEAFYVEIAYRFVKLARKLHSEKNQMPLLWRNANLAKRIKWEDVDVDDDIFQMSVEPASLLSRTPAGRQQAVTEMMQAGLVNVTEGRRLMGHPDLKASDDMATAAVEDIMASIEHHLDGGEYEPPEPYQDLNLGMRLYQQACLKARRDGAPDEVLDLLHTWIAQAKQLLDQAAMEQMAQQQQAAMAADPAMGGGGGAPAPSAAAPGNDQGTPTPAMSSQAMNIMPSYGGG